MNRMIPAAPMIAFILATAAPAAAQVATQPAIEPGHALLTVNAEGRSTRAPDLAVFSAGVTTQADTASAALADNSRRMTAVIAALKGAGIAPRDIQTSNLNLNPVYAPPVRQPDGSYEQAQQRVIGYQVNNTVAVRQRKLDQYGRVLDTLVGSGANQVNGPSFQLDQPDAAADEARAAAIAKARARADLYARAAALRVVRIVSISEGGGYSPPMPMMRKMSADMVAAAPAPVEAGELDVGANVTVQFELAP